MKYLDEYRDEKIARALAQEIRERVTRSWVLMEICGGQTHTCSSPNRCAVICQNSAEPCGWRIVVLPMIP